MPVRSLLPANAGEVSLTEAYAVPPPGVLHVRANMVVSGDGAGSAGGASAPLSSPADKKVFGVLRDLADVVLVGAGTVRAEGYGPVRRPPGQRVPPIAVVTSRPDLDPVLPFFTQAQARPLLLTTARADTSAYDGVADVVVCGVNRVELPAALDALAARRLTRVLCEGGPRLLAQLAEEGLVDELCLTLAPRLAGPGAGRVVSGPAWPGDPRALRLEQVLEEDGFLFLRYGVSAPGSPDPSA